MKKQYEKPMMAVEYFALTQAIASCTLEVPYMDSVCVLNSPLPDETKSWAINGWCLAGHCDNFETGSNPNDGLCYHTQMASAFTS